MGLLDDLAEVAGRPDIRLLALRRAGSRDRAEDALQQAYWDVARTPNPEGIHDLRAYFCRALIREINHQLARPVAAPVEDIDTAAILALDNGPTPGSSPPSSVESEAVQRLLAEKLVNRLDRDRDTLTACVPARSSDPKRYQAAIIAAARKLLCLLLEGHVTQSDWNAVIRSADPLWCDEAGLEPDAAHQRLSRARRDVKALLQMIVSQAELAF